MESQKRNKIIIENMSLVKKIAWLKKKEIGYPQVAYEELVSAGYSGLIEATDQYDENQGSFKNFASKRISGAMTDYVREFFRWIKWAPRDCKVISLFNVDESKLFYYDEQLENTFREIVDILPPLGKKILYWYYVDRLTLKQIGKKLDVSDVMIYQMLSKYKQTIRNHLR